MKKRKETKGKSIRKSIFSERNLISLSISLSPRRYLWFQKCRKWEDPRGFFLLGIPAFYPDLSWESWERSQPSHSNRSGGSESVGGAEAEREENPWSDSPASPKLCKACEGALGVGGVAEILGVPRWLG